MLAYILNKVITIRIECFVWCKHSSLKGIETSKIIPRNLFTWDLNFDFCSRNDSTDSHLSYVTFHLIFVYSKYITYTVVNKGLERGLSFGLFLHLI